MEHPFFLPVPRVIAHRGDSACFPENTLTAFTSARDIGVDCIETDVHLTADSEVVIWHDDLVDRNTNGTGRVEELTLERLKSLDAGFRFSPDGGKSFPFRETGVRIITLDEALESLPGMKFNVDMKTKGRQIVEACAACVRRHEAQDRLLWASFHHANLKYFRSLVPEAATSFSKPEAFEIVMSAHVHLPVSRFTRIAQALQVPIQYGIIQVISPKLLEHYQKSGIIVQVWTINDRPTMEELLDMGVDGIFTDNPRQLLEILHDRSTGGKM